MNFDFDTVIGRSEVDSVKWGKYAGRDIIPLWVADMDFAAPSAVLDALKRRIDAAARYLPLEQLALSPQCGFASDSGGNKISYAEQVAKLRLVVEVADEVWG